VLDGFNDRFCFRCSHNGFGVFAVGEIIQCVLGVV
jgi:hypothetical protein